MDSVMNPLELINLDYMLPLYYHLSKASYRSNEQAFVTLNTNIFWIDIVT